MNAAFSIKGQAKYGRVPGHDPTKTNTSVTADLMTFKANVISSALHENTE